MPSLYWLVLAACAVTVLTPLVRSYATAAGMIDQPGPRRSHTQPVARGGGLVLLPVCTLIIVFGAEPDSASSLFLLGAAAVTAVGWLDDRYSLDVRWRLTAQLLVAMLAIAWLGPVTMVQFAGVSISAAWLWTPPALLAMIWLINVFNFMDGSDGLATSQALISCALFGWCFFVAGDENLALLAWLVAAASSGFLFWNAPSAAIFLGDAGSLFLGWSVALFSLMGAIDQSVSVWQSAIITSPFVVDATLTLLSRVRRKEQWYTAHRDHAYQVLLRMGWSHRQVLTGLILVNSTLVLPAFILANRWPEQQMWIALLLAAGLTAVWCRSQFAFRGYRSAS